METDTSLLSAYQQLEILQSLNVGIIIINTDMTIKLWNQFMSNHTAIEASDAINQSLFTICPTLPTSYFKHKLKSVISLQSPLVITWQQRPHLFQLASYCSITSSCKKMYQDVRILPLNNKEGSIENIAIVIADVTVAARSHLSLQKSNRELTLASRLDPLTHLYNRGYWEQRLRDEYAQYARTKTPSVLVMLDIDHFKHVNDTYGHQGGDRVLKALGQLLLKLYRKTDLIGRYGGEEFGILLLDTTTDRALERIAQLTSELKKADIQHNQQTINITLSFGVTEISPMISSHDQWIDLADKALYKSKQNGRNQFTVLQQDTI